MTEHTPMPAIDRRRIPSSTSTPQFLDQGLSVPIISRKSIIRSPSPIPSDSGEKKRSQQLKNDLKLQLGLERLTIIRSLSKCKSLVNNRRKIRLQIPAINAANVQDTSRRDSASAHAVLSRDPLVRSGKKRSHHHKRDETEGLHTKLRSYTFRDIVHIVEVLVASTKHCRSHAVRAAEQNLQLRLMSLQQIRQAQRTPGSGSELLFDAGYFSSAASKNTHVRLNANAKHILMQPPEQRTLQSLQMVHKLFLRMKLLSQYPHTMQIQLCKVGFYSCFSASRVIIRQGHRPFYFYILISGSVMVNEMRKNEATGEMFATTRCTLEKGEQFGETALLLNSSRNATVVCQSDCELLVVDKQDFLPMFANHVKSATSHVSGTFKDLDHLRYLSTLVPFQRFPIDIFFTHPMNCVVHYFRKGSVIVRNINTEWLYVVKSGTCRVVTVVPLEHGLKDRARHILYRLRKMGFGEVEIYDLQVNSVGQKERNDRICEYIRTPDPKSPEHKTTDIKSPELKKSRRSKSQSQSSVISKRPDKVKMFVCVRILKPGDTFGLETIVGETPDIPLMVVSNNAECVMVSKKLYQMSVPADILISIKSRCQNFPYPSAQDICSTLCEQWEWFGYKKHVLCDTLRGHVLHMSQVMM